MTHDLKPNLGHAIVEAAENKLKKRNQDNSPWQGMDKSNSEGHVEFVLLEKCRGVRLDLCLSRTMGLTRSFVQKLIKSGNIVSTVESRLKPAFKVHTGMLVKVTLPPPEQLEVEPEPVDFDVVYQDSHILVIDKPAGVVVHPAPGHWHGTLVHGLLYRFPDIGNINNVIRPGIVHRLDATTSGLMIIARTQKAMENLQAGFRTRSINKDYLALIHGRPNPLEGTIDFPIARDKKNRLRMGISPEGKPSKTGYKVLWSRGGFSLVHCHLYTGRTHQIRVHFKYSHCPLAGDKLYGPLRERLPAPLDRVFLHSWKLSLKHPITGKDLAFIEPLPEDLKKFLGVLLSKK